MRGRDLKLAEDWVTENSFIRAEPVKKEPPGFADFRDKLPEVVWSGHEDIVRTYWRGWELAFQNLMQPTEESGFIANFIDAVHSGSIFMWDTAFMLMFGKYGSRCFDFQEALHNFYTKQHENGYICREIDFSSGKDFWDMYHPCSTGPNVLPWQEWEHYQYFGDQQRLAKVFPVLVAYHLWLRKYRTWKDGTYWSSGYACGMDNQPRSDSQDFISILDHGHLTWCDANLQMVLSCRCLLKMTEVLGRSSEIDLEDECQQLLSAVENSLWDPQDNFFYDCDRKGMRNGVRSIGAYWALLADCVPAEGLDRFVSYLADQTEFSTEHPIASLTKSHPAFKPTGNYWEGGVWSSTNYMVFKGLRRHGFHSLAQELALRHLQAVSAVCEDTNTLWEMYAADGIRPGTQEGGELARRDFVGWIGLTPIAILFEYVFGFEPRCDEQKLRWYPFLLDEFELRNYGFGSDTLLSLKAAGRASESEPPRLEVVTDRSLTLEVYWNDKRWAWEIEPGKHFKECT